MESWTVFYAWQSDLPRALSRDVIRRAGQAAVTRLCSEPSIEDAPRLDAATQGVAGLPDIAGTIYSKIDRADVFLADVSLVATNDSPSAGREPKRLPNSNVMMELGYAAKSLGWDRICNEHCLWRTT